MDLDIQQIQKYIPFSAYQEHCMQLPGIQAWGDRYGDMRLIMANGILQETAGSERPQIMPSIQLLITMGPLPSVLIMTVVVEFTR